MKLTRRYFDCPADMSRNYPVFIPNFKELEKEFYKNLKTLQQTTMIWGVAYSRLDPKQKMNLFKKYYTSETYYSIYKICKRTKNAELLKWLLEQQ